MSPNKSNDFTYSIKKGSTEQSNDNLLNLRFSDSGNEIN